jgi:uncharacterized protein YndB with AHSA1/START domain
MSANEQAVALAVKKSITVPVSQGRAFEVFCSQMGRWWPLDDKRLGSVKAEDAVLEPRAGGRWYEVGIDGSECDWGRVLAYEPPSRLVLDWQVSARWQFDPDLHTEVEIVFIEAGSQLTRVELEHRGLEAYSDDASRMTAIFDSPDGWAGLLGAFQVLIESGRA